jgi:uncharacterized protein
MPDSTMPEDADVVALRTKLSVDLRVAMKARDVSATAAIRAVLSRLDNANAVDMPGALKSTYGGPAEVPRRALTWIDADAILAAEASERDAAASTYDELGMTNEARRFRSESDVIRRYRR